MLEPRYRIVVAIDLTEYAEVVLEHALDQAAHHARPDLHFVTVVARSRDAAAAREKLATMVLQAFDCFRELTTDWRARLHVREGHADDEIVELAAEIRADLLVLGRFGGHDRGTFAGRIVTGAPCPTLVVTLHDQSPDHDACTACASVRADSDGERLFCDAHTDDRLVSKSLTAGWTGGTLMW